MAARTRLLERVALIAQEKLNQPERALKAYERILATDPRNRGAALALLPLYRDAQKWPRLLATYEVLLGPAAAGRRHHAGRPAGAATPRRARSASSGSGRRRWRSSGARARSRRRPKNEAVRTDLERLAGEADEWGNLAALYDARTAATTDAEERLWLLRRTLRIAATRLFRPQDARKAAEQIIAEVGFDEEADAALEQILTQTKAWARSGQAAARARRSRARRRRARAPAVPHRAARGRARGRRGRGDRHLEEDPRGGADQRARAAGAGPSVRGAPGLGGRGRGAAARSRRPRPADNREEREALLLRIANIQEVRLDDPEATFATYREVLQAQPARGAGGRGPGAAAGAAATPTAPAIARLTLPFYERTGDAPKLAGGQRGAAGGRRHARREGRAAGEAARALRAGRPTIRRAPTAPALALFEIDPADAKNRDALVGFAERGGQDRRAGRAGCARCRRETEDQILRRDLLVVVAELQEKRLGRAAGRREGLRPDPQGRAAARGRVPGADAPLSRRAALGRAARAARHAPAAPSWTCASGWTCSRRSRSWTSRRWTTRTTRSPSTRRCWSSTPRICARTARWIVTTPRASAGATSRTCSARASASRPRPRWRSWSSGAPSCARATSRTYARRARPAGTDRQDGAQPRGRAPPAGEAGRDPEHRQRVAKILEPVYEASSAWARLAAILDVEREVLDGPAAAAMLARIADLQENKLQAKRRGAGDLAPGAGRRSGQPGRAAARSSGSARRWSASPSWSTSTRSWRSRRTRPTSPAAPTCCRARPSCTRGASATGAPPSTSGSWCSPSIPNDADTTAPAAAALEALYTETGDVAGLVKILAHAGALGAVGAPTRKKILFRIAELQEKSLSDIDGGGGHAALDPGDRSAGARRDRRARSHLRGGRAAPPARRDHAQAHRHGRRRDRAPGAVAAGRGPARARRRRRRRGDRRLRQHPRREPAGRSGAGDAGAALRAAGAPPPAAGDPRAPAGARRPARARTRVALLRQIAALLEGPLGDPADALGRWREVLEAAPGRPGRDGGAGALPGAGHRRRPAAGGGAGAGADLREERPLRRAGGGGARLRRGADRRARAGWSS